MAEKKLEDLPPVYSNLGYDVKSEAGPSAPINQASSSYKDDVKSEAGPSAPINQASSSYKDLPLDSAFPTAPLAEVNLGPPTLIYDPPALVFEDIYDACVHYVEKHCCYGSRFIKRMKLTEIINKPVYHYKLESFGEKRESAPVTVPYKGGAYDGPENGPAPNVWDIAASPPTLFMDCKVEKDIPHTTTVHICSKCDGIGKVTCSSCFGRGRNTCWSCSGRGRNSEGNRCSSCSGSGTQRCSRCWGSGRVTCSKCDGYGKVKKYKIVIVTWKNHSTDFVTDTGAFPQKKILKTQGIQLLIQVEPTLQPIQNAADESVNAASRTMIGAHLRSFPSEMIIRQRHVLRALPLTQVKYQWKEREGEFYVYGTAREVYFEDYPQSCCCCTCC